VVLAIQYCVESVSSVESFWFSQESSYKVVQLEFG